MAKNGICFLEYQPKHAAPVNKALALLTSSDRSRLLERISSELPGWLHIYADEMVEEELAKKKFDLNRVGQIVKASRALAAIPE